MQNTNAIPPSSGSQASYSLGSGVNPKEDLTGALRKATMVLDLASSFKEHNLIKKDATGKLVAQNPQALEIWKDKAQQALDALKGNTLENSEKRVLYDQISNLLNEKNFDAFSAKLTNAHGQLSRTFDSIQVAREKATVTSENKAEWSSIQAEMKKTPLGPGPASLQPATPKTPSTDTGRPKELSLDTIHNVLALRQSAETKIHQNSIQKEDLTPWRDAANKVIDSVNAFGADKQLVGQEIKNKASAILDRFKTLDTILSMTDPDNKSYQIYELIDNSSSDLEDIKNLLNQPLSEGSFSLAVQEAIAQPPTSTIGTLPPASAILSPGPAEIASPLPEGVQIIAPPPILLQAAVTTALTKWNNNPDILPGAPGGLQKTDITNIRAYAQQMLDSLKLEGKNEKSADMEIQNNLNEIIAQYDGLNQEAIFSGVASNPVLDSFRNVLNRTDTLSKVIGIQFNFQKNIKTSVNTLASNAEKLLAKLGSSPSATSETPEKIAADIKSNLKDMSILLLRFEETPAKKAMQKEIGDAVKFYDSLMEEPTADKMKSVSDYITNTFLPAINVENL